jgi:hypothetical protein
VDTTKRTGRSLRPSAALDLALRQEEIGLGQLLEVVEPLGEVLEGPRPRKHELVRHAVVHLGVVGDVLAQAVLAGTREDHCRRDPRPAGGRLRFAPFEPVIVDTQLQPGDRLPQRHTPSI